MYMILRFLPPLRRDPQQLGAAPLQEQIDEPRIRRRFANETCCCARYSRRVGLVSALLLTLWPAGGASAVGALDPIRVQAALPARAESHSQESPSQWNLQIERKWRAGRPLRYQPLGEQGRATNLPSPVVTPTLDEPPGANGLPNENLRTYISVSERPPAAVHIAPATEPKTDLAAETATPSAPGPYSDARVDERRTALATAIGRAEAETEPLLVAVWNPAPILKPKPTPDLVVTRTVWHPFAVSRTVRVEVSGGAPVELKEGGRVGLLEVGTIEPSGVNFRYDGVEIFRKVGEKR
jgi:hypothetical protein